MDSQCDDDETACVLHVDASSTHQVAARITSDEQREVNVVVGETLNIECVASGWPVPRVTWSRYGGRLPRQRQHQRNGSTLFLYLSNNRAELMTDRI